MKTFPATVFAAFLSAPLLTAPVLAQDTPSTDIVSPVPEALEDCDALAESLRARRDDNVLNAQDMQEMRDKGC